MATGSTARSERIRSAILAAAADQFLDRGFLGASMDDIASVASVSKQTVYAHFENKESLFLAMVRGLTGAASDSFQEQLGEPASGEPVDQFLLAFARLQLHIVMTPRLMRLRRLAIGEAGRFPELGRALHEKGPARSIDKLARAFSSYRMAGHLSMRDDEEAATFFNWLVMGGPVNAVMLLGDEEILDGHAIDRHSREAVRIFLAAYGAKP